MMKRTLVLGGAVSACLSLASLLNAAAISQGNLVVVRAGTGVAINGNATAAFLEEFTTAGAAVQTIAMPTSASGSNGALTLSGSATSEGFLQISTNGQYLTMAGYNAVPGTLTPQTSAASAVNRVVGRVTIGSGAVDTSTILTNAHDGSNIRSAVTTDGTDIWTGGNAGSGLGASGGVTYTTLGSSTSTRVNTGAGSGSNSRVVNVFAGQLYVSAASTPRLAVQQIGTGTPMVAGATETTLTGMPTSGSHSTYDYWFADANTVYLADDGSAANGGGIQKWVESSGTWSLAYTLLNTGSATTAVRGLTGYVDGGGSAVLFATTTASSANNLIMVSDTGASATASILATAATGTVFRGVEYVPEPASLGLLAIGGLLISRRRA